MCCKISINHNNFKDLVMFSNVSSDTSSQFSENLFNIPPFESKVLEEKESNDVPVIVQKPKNTINPDKKVEDISVPILSAPQIEAGSISSNKLSFGSRILSKISTLFTKIKSIFVLYLIIKPSMNKHISKQLKNIDPKEYRENYTKLTNSSNELLKYLKTKYKSVSLFPDKFLITQFENKLADKTNSILKKNKLPLITKDEMQKASSERSLISLVENPSTPLELANELLAIPSHRMPIDLLAKVELNDQNKDVLLNTWKRVIVDLPEIGSLDQLDSPYLKEKASLRVDCALKLVEALKFAPKSLDPNLDELLNKHSEEKYQADLVNFIIHENSMSKKPIDLKYPELIEKQNVYLAAVKPALIKILKSFTCSKESQTAVRTLLIDSKMKKRVGELYKSLKVSQQHLFTENDIEKILTKEIEVIAVTKYNLTSLQLENLRNSKKKKIELENKKKAFKSDFKKQIDEFKQINEKYQKYAKDRFKDNEIERKKALTAFTNFFSNEIYKNLKSKFSDIEFFTEMSTEVFSEMGKKKYDDGEFNVFSEICLHFINDFVEKKIETINSSDDFDFVIKEVSDVLFFEKKMKKIALSPKVDIAKISKIGFLRSRIKNPEFVQLLSLPYDKIVYPYFYDLLYGPNVVSNIKKLGYDHPSGISGETIIDLMKINRAVLLNNTDCYVAEHHKKELLSALQRLAKTPNISEILKKFENNDHKADKLRTESRGLVGLFSRMFRKIKPAKVVELYKIPAGISKSTLNLARSYLKMQEQYPKLIKNLPKAQNLLQKYQESPESVKPSERLTLNEIGSIDEFAKFDKSLAIYKKLGIDSDPVIKDFYQTSKRATEVKEQFEKILFPAFRKHYSSGDIFAYYGELKNQWGAKALSASDKLAKVFCGGKTHGMKVYRDGDELRGSEISENYENTKMRIYDIAISDAWRVNVAALVSKNSAEKLKEILGKDWAADIQSRYEKIEENIHGVKSKKYKKIKNDVDERNKAGMADWKWLFNIVKPITRLEVKGHTKKHEQDFGKIYETFMGGNKVKETQICSEFASKTTLVAILKLNRVIAKLISEKNPEFLAANIHADLVKKGVKLPKDVVEYLDGVRKFGKERSITKKAEQNLKNILKRQKFSNKDIDLIIRLNNKEVIDLPYDRRERMNAIHPERMISLLEKKKCVTKLTRPKELDDLIQVNGTKRVNNFNKRTSVKPSVLKVDTPISKPTIMRNDKESLEVPSIQRPIKSKCKIKKISQFIELDRKLLIADILKKTEIVDTAWDELNKQNDTFIEKNKVSLLEGKNKDWYIERLQKGFCFGINMVLEDYFKNNPDAANEEIINYLNSTEILKCIVQYQMLHLTISNATLSEDLLADFSKFNFSIKPNYKTTCFATNKSRISKIQYRFSEHIKNLNSKNEKKFSVIFFKGQNPRHIIHFQLNKEKGCRFYDQSLGLSKWFNEKEFSEFLKSFFHSFKEYSHCIYN